MRLICRPYPHTRMLAIDPGSKTGWALVSGDGSVAVGAIKWFEGVPDLPVCDVVVVERPTIYPGSRVDPKAITTLSLRAGILAGISAAPIIAAVEPRTWKGNLPKTVHHNRLAKDYPEILPHIMAAAPTSKGREDVWDAFGLLVWACSQKGLGRYLLLEGK